MRTLFTVAALTGARLSELLGLTWANVRAHDLDDAEIEFAWQVDRHGNRRPTKTDGSARTVPIPRALARMLVRHRTESSHRGPDDFVFATRTGRPLGQRNVARALRSAQVKATDDQGNPTFPALHDHDEPGRPHRLPHGALPSMHSFRHTVASRCAPRGRERRRGCVPPRTPRRERDAGRLRAGNGRCAPTDDEAVSNDGRVRRTTRRRWRS